MATTNVNNGVNVEALLAEDPQIEAVPPRALGDVDPAQ
jgi:hypothetical protein